MLKRVIVTFGLGVVLSTSVFGFGGDYGYKQNIQKHHKCMKHHKRGDKGDGTIRAIMSLDLSAKQRKSIVFLLKEYRKSRPNIANAFSTTSFDKSKFLDIKSQKILYKTTMKADLVEKIYNLLDAKQKENLKTLLDYKATKKSGGYGDKGCHGRR
jgi:hypothetical protein